MSEYSDLQIALINARDTYEGCRNEFPDPKDRRIHKRQCDLISNHIRDLPQLTAAQSDNEALRARVAELESDNLHQRERRNAARDCIRRMSVENKVATLRQQAEAFESEADRIDKNSLGNAAPLYSVCLRESAQRLRQQADEIEKAGGAQ